ncbi:hypothetical protein B0H11DRAFT_272721 [Mycena galericulata]|nr:hypothetical protein B0H11DRAFT_272721 [Mycena galericulata]
MTAIYKSEPFGAYHHVTWISIFGPYYHERRFRNRSRQLLLMHSSTASWSLCILSSPFMADIVGLVASVLQLVDTVAKAHDYIQDFRNAPEEQQRLLLEVQNLDPLMRELDRTINDGEATGISRGMQEFEGSSIQLKTVMERLAKKLNPAGIRKVSNRLTWSLWGKEDVQEGLMTIERSKSLLNAWLGMDILNSAQGIKFALKEAAEMQRVNHDDLFQSVQHVAENQDMSHYTAKRDEIIEWCSPLNFFVRQADIFGTRQEGTGEWLLEDEKFTSWKSGTGKTLWCRGMPGAGKTVLWCGFHI